VDHSGTSSVSPVIALLRKRSTKYVLLVLNLAIPVLFLFAGFLHTRITAIPAVSSPLFNSPDQSWIDLLSDSQVSVFTSTLAPVLYATFASEVVPQSLVLTDGSGRNLRDEVRFWGGRAEVTPRQFLFAPQFDFYPGPLTFDLKYQDIEGRSFHFQKHIDLIFVEHFASPLDRRFWTMQQGIETTRWKDKDVLSLEPGDREKSALVFSKSYRKNAEVEVEFIPDTATPNLSISFNERISFIIGDGTNTQIKFKHGLVVPNMPNRYFQIVWPVSPLIAGELYTAHIKRAGNSYTLLLKDSRGTVLSSISFVDDKTDAFDERFPVISLWVFRNTHSSILARTYLRRMTVFFSTL
jgi:hypothetical protein